MPVYDVAEERGVVYYSMPFARRGALSARAAGAAPAPETVVRWLEATARAVHHAHRHGVVHCDLKPSNVLLDDEDRPLVGDFGLAQESAGAAEDDPPGALVGSPAYMAPEQITAREGAYSPPVDIWALGVLLYELLTGERPFASDHLPALRQMICRDEPAPLRRRAPGLPAWLEAVCARCLAKDPSRRYPSAEALADDLRACL
jgi:serine/threonine-protein kinase